MFRPLIQFVAGIGFALTLIGLVTPAQAQDPAPITLVPFEDPNYFIEGVIPEGWQTLGQGLYTPDPANPQTLLALQAAPTSPDRVLEVLLPQLGLTTAPESVGTQQTAELRWELYQVDVPVGGQTIRVDLALAERDAVTYIALVQGLAADYDRLHTEVFVPVLDALTPVPNLVPLPYVSEEVTFTNGDITFSGTFTRPNRPGQHPAVVLMTGSGAQTRDSEVIPGFKIFALIAEHLTLNGIAVLRYDDRGTGFSEGVYNEATVQDLASDGLAAVRYLQTRADVNTAQIGVIGHSEGGVYAAILGAQPDTGISFIVSLAGLGTNGFDLLKRQNELLLAAAGASPEQIQGQLAYLDALLPLAIARDWEAAETLSYQQALSDVANAPAELTEGMTEADKEAYARQSAEQFIAGYATEWFATLLQYDPAPDWQATTVPVLGIFGGRDLQVDAEQNAEPMRAALEAGGNPDVTVVTLPRANHLFQEAVIGSMDEYMALGAEFDSDFLPTLTDWLIERVTVVPEAE
jgi:hypothetical protein